VWNAETVGAPETWTCVLDDNIRKAIIDAATAMRERGVTLATATRADFDLDRLRPLLAAWTQELQHGRGFVLVRGFPVDQLDEETSVLAYFALGLQLGQPVSQDAAGALLGHVRDQGVPRTSPAIRRYATNERQDFHTDGADIIGLLCLQRARRGGESRIASAAAVYNEMLARDPQGTRSAVRTDVLGPQRRTVARRRPILRNAGALRRRWTTALLLHRLVHPRRATPSGRATTHRPTGGRYGTHRSNRQRSDISR
jgi:hypothetical protein